MSLKFSNTTADYLEWNEAMNLIRNLYNDKKYVFSLYIAISVFWGLRVSDVLKLKFVDIINLDEITITEQKTGKKREIKINSQLKRHITDCYNQIKPRSINEFIFVSQKRTVYSIQRINVILKEIKTKYSLQVKNFSSHSLRKCFGRAIFKRSGANAELALIKLSSLFNHSNPATTRRYLGIAKQELMETYDLLGF